MSDLYLPGTGQYVLPKNISPADQNAYMRGQMTPAQLNAKYYGMSSTSNIPAAPGSGGGGTLKAPAVSGLPRSGGSGSGGGIIGSPITHTTGFPVPPSGGGQIVGGSGGSSSGSSSSNGFYTNPFSPAATQSAQQAGTLAQGQSAANIGQAGALRDTANTGYAGANAIMTTAFDPQNALYNRALQQVQDQQRVGQAARGITSSPYGAGLENQALQNFNIDWQNNQLGRQLQGLQGYATGLGAGREAAATAGNVGQMGVGQMQSVGQMPWEAVNQQQQTDLQNWIAYMNQQNAQTGLAIQNYPNLLAQQSMQNYGGVPYISGGNTLKLGSY